MQTLDKSLLSTWEGTTGNNHGIEGKGDVFWKTLNLVVNLTFLLLAVTIMTILLRNDLQRGDFSNYESVLQSAKQEIHRVNQSNFIYLEGKTNAVASNQDSYQTNTAKRLDVLEQRIKNLEDKRGNNSRIFNTNTNVVNK